MTPYRSDARRYTYMYLYMYNAAAAVRATTHTCICMYNPATARHRFYHTFSAVKVLQCSFKVGFIYQLGIATTFIPESVRLSISIDTFCNKRRNAINMVEGVPLSGDEIRAAYGSAPGPERSNGYREIRVRTNCNAWFIYVILTNYMMRDATRSGAGPSCVRLVLERICECD